MRKPIGAAIGFAVGYYLGSMAGRERHEQINDLLRKAQRSEAVDRAGSKAREVVGRGKERITATEDRQGEPNQRRPSAASSALFQVIA